MVITIYNLLFWELNFTNIPANLYIFPDRVAASSGKQKVLLILGSVTVHDH